jgi:hypothetical protein
MANVRIKHRREGYKQLRSEPGVVADQQARGRRVQAAAESMSGAKYRMFSQQGRAKPQGRWRTSITTGDFRARRNNARYNELVRALDAGR